MEIEVKEIKTGLSLPIILPGLGTAGFQWFFKTDTDDFIDIKPYNYTVDSMLQQAGNSNDDVFLVTGKAPGLTNVIFEQRRIWEKEGVAINTKNLSITVVYSLPPHFSFPAVFSCED
jgi:hypothetical protein